ncbi:MAG TPA: hypothetical protein VK858_04425 [Longimicrobiales bacterium]|nr:hypothetical protein [Longimicrobiales bacterium]
MTTDDPEPTVPVAGPGSVEEARHPPPPAAMQIGPIVREVLILVAGILIALGLESWRDGRVEQGEVRAELRSVQVELQENLPILDGYIRWHERSLDATEDMLALLSAGRDVDVPDSTVWGVGFTPTYDPRRGALDALISSGRLALVQDPELRRALAAHGGALQDARDEETRSRAYVDLQLGTVLGRSGNTARPQSVNWRDPGVPEEARGRHTRITYSQELENHLARRRLFAILSIESLRAARVSVVDLTQRITRLLDD